MQPKNLKSEDFLSELKALNANLQIVVAFRMLPEVVWKLPEYGTFNLHASLLPNYRGAAPIHWAIINGETQTGVTTFFIDERIDTGEILLSQSIAIGPDETVGQLHDRLMDIGSQLVVDTVKAIERGDVQTIPQPQSKDLKTAYKLHKDTCKIDWTASIEAIYNKIRGLNPFPAAWCYLENNGQSEAIKLFGCQKILDTHSYEVGSIYIKDKTLLVACQGGYIEIQELQLPNKRKMATASLLNGYNFSESAKML